MFVIVYDWYFKIVYFINCFFYVVFICLFYFNVNYDIKIFFFINLFKYNFVYLRICFVWMIFLIIMNRIYMICFIDNFVSRVFLYVVFFIV